MKRTVSFFIGVQEYLKNSLSFSFMLALIAGLGVYILSNQIHEIICLATNVRIVSNKKSYSIKDVISAYPVFNGDNYIVAKEKKTEVVEQKEENIINDTDLFDASAVDAISNIITIDAANYSKKTTKTYNRIDIYGITIYDYSSKNIDYKKLFERNINLTKKSDPVLIYCSHTSETYTNSDNFKFEYTGNYRTKDGQYNMLSVAGIMANTLKERGLTCVFDTTPHDYTSYDNAYKNSMKTIQSNLEKYSRFGIMIDVHRDAAADLSFGPETTINSKTTAKLMLVVGVGYEGYPNEYWEENLSIALKIAKLGEEMYPGLFRQILVRDARYNQHLSAGSLLVEVGATGNTLEEAYYGARCFANILSKLYK